MTTTQKAALVIGLSAFLFVVVCPLTVTPTAVTKSPAPLVALIALPILTAPTATADVLPDAESLLQAPEHLLETLCTRLC